MRLFSVVALVRECLLSAAESSRSLTVNIQVAVYLGGQELKKIDIRQTDERNL